MTFFDNLKNKLFKEENSGKGKDSQPAEKSKNLQNKIKGFFAKKPFILFCKFFDFSAGWEIEEFTK